MNEPPIESSVERLERLDRQITDDFFESQRLKRAGRLDERRAVIERIFELCDEEDALKHSVELPG